MPATMNVPKLCAMIDGPRVDISDLLSDVLLGQAAKERAGAQEPNEIEPTIVRRLDLEALVLQGFPDFILPERGRSDAVDQDHGMRLRDASGTTPAGAPEWMDKLIEPRKAKLTAWRWHAGGRASWTRWRVRSDLANQPIPTCCVITLATTSAPTLFATSKTQDPAFLSLLRTP
jgi:hypothetical protein